MSGEFNSLPLVGIRSLAALLDLDRDTIRGAMARAELKPAGTRGGHPVYALADALRALFARRGEMDPAMLTPTDRRALADAKLRELELERRRGDVLPRADVAQATAQAFAICAQSLRSIPDNIERRLGVSPEIAEEIGLLIDETMNTLADDLERAHNGKN